MDTRVIKEKKTLWFVFFEIVTFLLVMYVNRETKGLVILVALCGLFVVLATLGMAYTVTLTREQIICKSLFRPMTAAWADVTNISVVSVAKGWYISITRTDKCNVLIPYSDELRDAILTHRGFLDCDDKSDPPTPNS